MHNPSDEPFFPIIGELTVTVFAAYPAGRAGLVTLLSQDPEIAAEGAPLEQLASFTDEPRLLAIDLNGLSDETVESILGSYPDTPALFLGIDNWSGNLQYGDRICGYLTANADADMLSGASRALVAGLQVTDGRLFDLPGGFQRGGPRPSFDSDDTESLTPREHQVLTLLAEGLPNKGIARELGISEHTAKFHVGSVLAKMGAGSRAEAVMQATRRGLLPV